MNQAEYARWSERAREYGLRVVEDSKVVEQSRQLFYYATDMMSNHKQEKTNV